jgi:hypothetical protein
MLIVAVVSIAGAQVAKWVYKPTALPAQPPEPPAPTQ